MLPSKAEASTPVVDQLILSLELILLELRRTYLDACYRLNPILKPQATLIRGIRVSTIQSAVSVERATKDGTSSEAESNGAIESHLPVQIPIFSYYFHVFGAKGLVEWRGGPRQIHK